MSTEPLPTPPPVPAPQSRVTLVPPKEVQQSPSQIFADNASTRLREIAAIAGFVLMACLGKLDGVTAVGAILAVVVPIEVTRQVAKGRAAVASITGGGVATALAIFATVNKALTLGAIGLTAVALVTHCSASDVRTQALVAHATADGFNRAQEHVLDQYEEAGRAAARASCCDRARMTAAVDAVDHAWVPVIVGWEAARVDHDAWREKLMQCQTTPAETCGVELVTLEHAFLRSATAARCALVALGEPDPLADVGAISCSSGSPSSSPPPPSSSAPPPTAPSAIPRPVPHLGGAS
jgi:hypothetical protein